MGQRGGIRGNPFKSPLINFTRDGPRRVSFSAGIDYRDDTAAARRLLRKTVRALFRVESQPPPACNMSAPGPQYVELDVFLRIDTFRADVNLAEVRNEAMGGCRRALLEGGFTISSNVATNVEMVCLLPLEVRLPEPPGAGA